MRQGLRPSAEQEDVDRDLAAIRQMIEEETFDAAYTEGQAMTMEEAIAYTLADNNVLRSINDTNHE